MFDQQIGLFRRRLSFRRRVSFDMEEWGYQRDLELDLLTTQCGSARQARNLAEGTRELLYCFDQCRALQRPLSRFAPKPRRLLDLPSLSAMTRQQFGLVFRNLGELAFEGFGNASVKLASRLAQQRPVGGVLYKCVH